MAETMTRLESGVSRLSANCGRPKSLYAGKGRVEEEMNVRADARNTIAASRGRVP
jgi:hypothetical protein